MLIRSEEHTSELQSRSDLVCRLLLEKKNHENVIADFDLMTGLPIACAHNPIHAMINLTACLYITQLIKTLAA